MCGSIENIRQIIQYKILSFENERNYYLEITNTQAVNNNQPEKDSHTSFNKKVLEVISDPEKWIVLNTFPGELCKNIDEQGATNCFRHCQRLRQSTGDQHVLNEINDFVILHPEFEQFIRITNIGEKIQEIAIQGHLLLKKTFSAYFEKFFLGRIPH